MAGTTVRPKLLAGIVFSLLIGLAITPASHKEPPPEAPDQFTYDWRNYFWLNRPSVRAAISPLSSSTSEA